MTKNALFKVTIAILLIAGLLCACSYVVSPSEDGDASSEVSSSVVVPITTAANNGKIAPYDKNVETANPEDRPENFPVNDLPYFIYVEKGSHTITIYEKDRDGKYTVPLHTWQTAIGKVQGLTPAGLFSLDDKLKWKDWGRSLYSPYASGFAEGVYIHGPVYLGKRFASIQQWSFDGIGKNHSSGCLRTGVEAAFFVYDNCFRGTGIKIVEGSPLKREAEPFDIKTQLVSPEGEPDPPPVYRPKPTKPVESAEPETPGEPSDV